MTTSPIVQINRAHNCWPNEKSTEGEVRSGRGAIGADRVSRRMYLKRYPKDDTVLEDRYYDTTVWLLAPWVQGGDTLVVVVLGAVAVLGGSAVVGRRGAIPSGAGV